MEIALDDYFFTPFEDAVEDFFDGAYDFISVFCDSECQDKIEVACDYILMGYNKILVYLVQFLYFFKVSPIVNMNHQRTNACNSLPEYGTLEYKDILNHSPLDLVLCSDWFGDKLNAVEDFWILDYTLIKEFTEEVNDVINYDYKTGLLKF